MNRLSAFIILLTVTAFFNSCSTSKIASKEPTDDIYYTSKDDKNSKPKKEVAASEKSETGNDANYGDEVNPESKDAYAKDKDNQIIGSGSGDTYNNNYYYDNDYYYNNYPYSTRIRRFYRPSCSFNYYDPFYNPGYWGGGSGWSFNMYYGSGYPSYGFYDPYYDPFYNPWYYSNNYGGYGYNPYCGYGGYGGYNSYWSGYNNGYNSGWYDSRYYGGGYGYYGGSSSGYSGSNKVNRPRTEQGSYDIYNKSVKQLPTRIRKDEQDNNNTIGSEPAKNSTNDNGFQNVKPQDKYGYQEPSNNTKNTSVPNQQPSWNSQNQNQQNEKVNERYSTGDYQPKNNPVNTQPKEDKPAYQPSRQPVFQQPQQQPRQEESQPSWQKPSYQPSYTPSNNQPSERPRNNWNTPSNNSSPSYNEPRNTPSVPSNNNGGGDRPVINRHR